MKIMISDVDFYGSCEQTRGISRDISAILICVVNGIGKLSLANLMLIWCFEPKTRVFLRFGAISVSKTVF